MCVIAYKPKGVALSKSDADLMWGANPHGAGFAVWDEKSRTWQARKGFMSFPSLWEAIEPYTGVDHILVVHFRIVSRGRVCPEQTHPFEIKLKEGGVGYLFHNGTLHSSLALSLGGSDTMELAHRLSQLRLEKEQLKLLLEEGGLLDPLRSGSRFALCLPGEEEPLLVGRWEKANGLLVSNTGWKVSLSIPKAPSWWYGWGYKAPSWGHGWGYDDWGAKTKAKAGKPQFAKAGKLTFRLVSDAALWVPNPPKGSSAVEGTLLPYADMLVLYVEDEQFYVEPPEDLVSCDFAVDQEGRLYRLRGTKAVFEKTVKSFKELVLERTTLAIRYDGELLVLSEDGLLESYSLRG